MLPPNGVDDTAALVAAMSADSCVQLQAGTYRVAPGLSIPPGVTLRGVGAASVLTAAAGAGSGTLIDMLEDDSELADLAIDGTPASSTYLVLIGGARGRLTRCTLKGGGGYGVHVVTSTDVRVIDNMFVDIPSYAVLTENAVGRLSITGNTFLNATGGQGVTVKVNPGSPTDVRIVGNVVDVAGMIGLEIQGAGATRGVIDTNVVRHAGIGISLSSSNGITVTGNTCADNPTYGIEAAQAATDCTISGNTILRPGTGVIVSSSSSASVARNVTVSGNTVRDAANYGIQTEYGASHTIANNGVYDSGNRAIFCNNGPTGLVVTGNRVKRTVAGAASSDGIYLTGVGHNITGNMVDYRDLVTAAGYGIFANGADRCHIAGNLVVKAAKGIALVGGSSHAVVGNHTQDTSQHSVFTAGKIGRLYVDTHVCQTNGGVGVDMSGVVKPSIGTVCTV